MEKFRVGAVEEQCNEVLLSITIRETCGSADSGTSGPDTNWVSPDACRDDRPNLTDTPAYLIGEWLNLGEPAPYMFLLMIMSVVAAILVLDSIEPNPFLTIGTNPKGDPRGRRGSTAPWSRCSNSQGSKPSS